MIKETKKNDGWQTLHSWPVSLKTGARHDRWRALGPWRDTESEAQADIPIAPIRISTPTRPLMDASVGVIEDMLAMARLKDKRITQLEAELMGIRQGDL